MQGSLSHRLVLGFPQKVGVNQLTWILFSQFRSAVIVEEHVGRKRSFQITVPAILRLFTLFRLLLGLWLHLQGSGSLGLLGLADRFIGLRRGS